MICPKIGENDASATERPDCREHIGERGRAARFDGATRPDLCDGEEDSGAEHGAAHRCRHDFPGPRGAGRLPLAPLRRGALEAHLLSRIHGRTSPSLALSTHHDDPVTAR